MVIQLIALVLDDDHLRICLIFLLCLNERFLVTLPLKLILYLYLIIGPVANMIASFALIVQIELVRFQLLHYFTG